MKTIKEIELLNMTANKEYDKLPKKIKCFDRTYELKENRYYSSNGTVLEKPYFFGQDDELMQELEIIEDILDEKEKEYLSAVTKPFRNRILYICKDIFEDEYITITLKENNTAINYYLPPFKKNTMYKGMEIRKKYSLEELGL